MHDKQIDYEKAVELDKILSGLKSFKRKNNFNTAFMINTRFDVNNSDYYLVIISSRMPEGDDRIYFRNRGRSSSFENIFNALSPEDKAVLAFHMDMFA